TFASLIIDKRAVVEKYKGGIEQFRIDYFSKESRASEEDDEVFSIARMNSDEYDLERYIQMGFHYDKEKQSSMDFVIYQRYYGYLWKVDWITDNDFYAWHTHTPKELVDKVLGFGELTMDDISRISTE